MWPWPARTNGELPKSDAPAALQLAHLKGQLDRFEAMQRDLQPDVHRRLEELEDKYNRMERRFTKLQGEFNGYMRDRYEADQVYDEEEDTNG